MQTVRIPKTKKSSSNASDDSIKQDPKKIPPQNSKKDTKSDENNPWSFDPWASDPWGDDNNNTGQAPQKERLSPQDRVKMIGEVYKIVLGREPDTRDINYYKYSTLGKSEIITQLLEGKEHTKLVEEGSQYTKLKSRAEQSEIRAKVLENQIKDQVDEFKELTDLLAEKNRQIQSLRKKLNNPYDFTQPAQQAIERNQELESSSYSMDDNSTESRPVNNSKQVFTTEVRPVKPPKQSFISFVMEKLRDLVSI